ncbi:tenascin-like isoform X5 [Brachyhypopomus gauderio]|uniref:tenascin-like isoform X5 n=1 Tax=Brachyhypopomus gauderio TaxID=698409 RepID=UPI0040411397
MSFLFQLILVLLPSPTLLLPQNAALQHVSRDTKPQPIKVVISEPCVLGESSDAGGGREAELDGDSTVVLTHRIRLVPAAATATAGCGGCEVEMAVIRERIERLEKEVSELRGRCGGADGSCCTPQQSKGGGCTTVGPPTGACPDDCNDQGVCVEGRCDCFPGFSGPDCRTSNCPGNCHDNGKCVSGQCVCDPGFIGPDCSEAACPRNCSLHGRCMGGVCVCEPGLSGPDCSIKACPKSCSNRGRCVSGRCVCDPGFIGPACTARTCPGNCNRKGRCVNGKCVCETGVTGPDCSERSCPGNCKNRGQCVNGKCVCETGFTGPDCSERSCPGNCNDKGQCVNGQCVCDTGFTGPDCFTKTCPSNCNSNGKCVNGKCVCAASFTGVDCSSKSCPANCHDRGQCVDGHCVCDVDFTGPDCSTKSCPKNCSGRGFCVKGRCVCGRGSTGPDCGQCDYGFTGHDCRTVLSGVANLSTRDVTESSVTLFWTPPDVQYDTYHITFTSEKESDQKVVSSVSGRLTSYMQVGLAAGQQYTVTMIGEKEGKEGAVSRTEFQTLISGPKNLQVVKMSTTSIIVQWEQAQGDIDRYLLNVSPNQTDGSGPQETRLPPERDSAEIDSLEPGRLYDITLVAERDDTRSLPVTVQATPGPEPPSHLAFSEVSESSLMVSWTRPKSPVSGFKVTYMHTKDGEPVSMAVGSADSSLVLSQLSPGSSYEVSVLSLRGLDESEPIRDTVITLPDPPSDLDVINVTNTKALLLWRPALATVDQYVIVYSSEEAPGSELTIRVSGNTVEQALQALTSSTRYTVSISSQLGDIRSAGSATASFTTSGPVGRGEGPQDLKASQVTPRTALLSWKPPASAVTGYKLTYVTEGQEIKEVSLAPGVTEHKLRRLRPGSVYTANLQGERDGLYTATISTEFTTGSLRFPFPTDCSQELLNGLRESDVVEIFPGGRQTKPVMVYCDMDTDGGGWTVFQRRKDGKINFFRAWKEYRTGFGELDGEFWLGNDLLHNLTSMTPMTLRVDLRAGAEAVYAQYSTFSVGTAKKHFMLQVMGYSGTAGDSMKYHDKRPFSTWDRDPQPFITRCAMSYRGGWWYRNCHEANLNGLYGTHTNHQGLIWTAWKGTRFSIPFTEMKLRPTSFDPFSQT